MIPTPERVHSESLDPPMLAESSIDKPSESSEKAPALEVKVVIKTIAKDTSTIAKEGILKASKRCEIHVNVLFKLFQEEPPPTKVEGVDIKGVEARPIPVRSNDRYDAGE
ncbi:hypothetical protein BPOR_0531g00040 [Botrytis porri]|uniref:Uncharacterized protein n=2 Tax=Botrytis porri TaxID=87229 RepID=A0A4Z1KKX6_9HELO|nr:hypothetical protein BPOR_0531g00040 [Botrytis porri]